MWLGVFVCCVWLGVVGCGLVWWVWLNVVGCVCMLCVVGGCRVWSGVVGVVECGWVCLYVMCGWGL